MSGKRLRIPARAAGTVAARGRTARPVTVTRAVARAVATGAHATKPAPGGARVGAATATRWRSAHDLDHLQTARGPVGLQTLGAPGVQPGCVEVIEHRSRDQDLLALGRVDHASGDVHVDTQIVAPELARPAPAGPRARPRACAGGGPRPRSSPPRPGPRGRRRDAAGPGGPWPPASPRGPGHRLRAPRGRRSRWRPPVRCPREPSCFEDKEGRSTGGCPLGAVRRQKRGPHDGRPLEVAGAGFEPAKAEPTRLQRVPFDRSGTPPGAGQSSVEAREAAPRTMAASVPIRSRTPRTSSPPR